MKTIATINEWLQHKPDAWLRNDSFMKPKGMAIYSIQKHNQPVEARVPSLMRDDYPDQVIEPFLYIGPGCVAPYIVPGKFNYSCGMTNYLYPTGVTAYLSDKMAADPNWYEWNMEDFEQIVTWDMEY